MPSVVAVLTVYLHYLVTAVTSVHPGCDCVVYQSYGLSDGTFTSPNFPALYPNTNCILYSFFGDAFEIIQLTFFEFDLREPDSNGRCRDYVRIFQNLERPEVNENSHWDVELCGNYSSLKKRKFYSSNRSLILEFHTQGRNNTMYKGFKGVYQFLDKRNYTNTGNRVEGHPCTWQFTSNISRQSKVGQFFSPFYPQNYKPNLRCRYKLHAMPGETIRVVFSNIQLHHGGGRLDQHSCFGAPDLVTVYDGKDTNSNVIEQYCGFLNNQEIISPSTEMLIVFTSDSWLEEQGFAATYEFYSKSRSNPNTRQTNNTTEARCGEIISSLTHRNGTIESPNHPRSYPPDLTCRFIFQGVGKERVQLRFVHMDLYFPSGNPANPVGCTDSDSVTVYININGKATKLDTYCGSKLPPMLMSSGQSNGQAMIVEFRSYHSSSTVTGFRAEYEFVTNFGIKTGKQDSRGTCVFSYMSHQQKSGHITSPNYGDRGLYPRNTECHYLFYGRGQERVEITFLSFEVDGIPPRCEGSTDSDYVTFSNFAETEDRKLYRMCGQEPISSHKIESEGPFFRVTFKSNHIYDGHGFDAFYQFLGGTPPPESPPPENSGSARSSDQSPSSAATYRSLLCLLSILFHVLLVHSAVFAS